MNRPLESCLPRAATQRPGRRPAARPAPLSATLEPPLLPALRYAAAALLGAGIACLGLLGASDARAQARTGTAGLQLLSEHVDVRVDAEGARVIRVVRLRNAGPRPATVSFAPPYPVRVLGPDEEPRSDQDLVDEIDGPPGGCGGDEDLAPDSAQAREAAVGGDVRGLLRDDPAALDAAALVVPAGASIAVVRVEQAPLAPLGRSAYRVSTALVQDAAAARAGARFSARVSVWGDEALVARLRSPSHGGAAQGLGREIATLDVEAAEAGRMPRFDLEFALRAPPPRATAQSRPRLPST